MLASFYQETLKAPTPVEEPQTAVEEVGEAEQPPAELTAEDLLKQARLESTQKSEPIQESKPETQPRLQSAIA